jgi:N-acyl-D-amino-acid deacylase
MTSTESSAPSILYFDHAPHKRFMTSQLDIVLRGASVLDGSGTAAFAADIGIAGERIAAVERPGSLNGITRVDLTGLTLAPGFIDVHTHDVRQALAAPEMGAKLSQGVTTVITGNCGISLAPWHADKPPPAPLTLIGAQSDYRFSTMAAYIAAVTAAHPAVNVGTLIGHSTLRVNVVDDVNCPASPGDIARMSELLAEGMRAGALGMSSGLFYPTARAAANSEVIALARVAARYGGIYTSHIRDEHDGVLDALAEACDAGEAAGLPVVLSHHKCAGPANWGRSQQTLAFIAERQRRHPIGLDAYPYVAGSTILDPTYVDGLIRILITWSKSHPDMAGRDLSDIAGAWGVDQRTAAERLLPGGGVYFQMSEIDVRRILAYPHTMIGSDGLPHDTHPHPRLWGAFTRVLGHYCRDERLFHLAEAVRRMTTLSADTFGLKRRGRIAAGCAADLVAFDPAAVRDAATFGDPKRPSIGIRHVWVNGRAALEHGRSTGVRAGIVLHRDRERYGNNSESDGVAATGMIAP